MAVMSKEIARGQVVFCHAEVITNNNEANKDVFRFIGSVWQKLEPGCKCINLEGSIGGRIAIGVSSEEIARKADKTAIDHTAGVATYTMGSGVGDLNLDEDSDTGEDFWDEILKE